MKRAAERSRAFSLKALSIIVAITAVLHGANECGIESPGADSIVCGGSGYPSGISYGNSDGLTLTLSNASMSVGDRGAHLTSTAFTPVANDLVIHADSYSLISTTQVGAYGILAYHPNSNSTGDARIDMRSGTIRTTGNFGYGLFARTRGVLGDAEAELNGGSIQTHGWVGIGIYSRVENASAAGSATSAINAGTIDTWNQWGLGLYAYNNSSSGDSSVIINGGTIHTRNTSAYGAMAYIPNSSGSGDAIAVMNAGSVLVEGSSSVGIYAYNHGLGGAYSTMNDGNITLTSSSGLYGYGVETWIDNISSSADAVSAIHGGSVHVSAVNASAIYSENNGTGTARAVVDGDSVLYSVGNSGNGIGVGVSRAAASYSIVAGGNAEVHGSMVSGAGIRIDSVAGSSGTVYIGANTLVEGASAIVDRAGDTSVDMGGVLRGNGIYMGDGSDIVNIYSNADISSLPRLDGGDDTSVADGWIDHLRLTGQNISRSGSDLLNWEILSVDGGSLGITGGSITVGSDPGTGLRIVNSARVDAGNSLVLNGNLFTASAGVFDLSGGGAGTYRVTGSVTNGGSIDMRDGFTGDRLDITGDYSGGGVLALDVDTAAGVADTMHIVGNSNTSTTTIMVRNITPGLSSGTPILLVDVNGTSSAGDFRLGAAGVYGYSMLYSGSAFFLNPSTRLNGTGAVYQAFSSVMRVFCRPSTLRERKGRDYRIYDEGKGEGWLRIRSEHDKGEFSKQSVFERDFSSIQIGADMILSHGKKDEWVVGLNARHSHLSSGIDNPLGSGGISSTAYGIGATITWYGPEGIYLDIQSAVDFCESDLSSDVGASIKSDYTSTAYMVSLEGGYPIPLDRENRLIPQMQLSWGRVGGMRDFIDKWGEFVDMGDSESLLLRAGILYEHEVHDSANAASEHFYISGNIFYDFDPDSSVEIDNLRYKAGLSEKWGELSAGWSRESERNRLYAEISYGHNLGSDEYYHGIKVNAGISIKW